MTSTMLSAVARLLKFGRLTCADAVDEPEKKRNKAIIMRYGISFAGGPAEEKMELADFPYDIFPVAELSGDMLQTTRPTRQLIFESFEALHFRNLFPAPMSRGMAGQNRSIIRMFRENYARSCGDAMSCRSLRFILI